MSTNTFTRLLPSFKCGSGFPVISQLDPSLRSPVNRDMSNDPGVQILDVRPKTTNQMSRESGDRTNRSWHRHFHPSVPQEEAHNRLAPMLRRPPQHGPLRPLRSPLFIEAPSDPPRTFTRYPSHQPTLRRREDYETGEDSGIEQGSMNGQGEVIDLTGDEPEEPPRQAQSSVTNRRTSQLPRPFRYVNGPVSRDEIVDLVDEPDEPAETADGPPSSPEVQFLSSSRRPHATQHPYPDRNRRDYDRNNEPFFQSMADFRARGLWGNRSPAVPREPSLNSRLPPAGMSMLDYMSSRPRYRSHNDGWDSDNDGGGYDGFDEAFDPEGFNQRDLERWRRQRGLVNLTIDYGLAAFPIGSTPVTVNQESARPAYKPPSPAPEGFTRTLADEDVAICPNCACELGVGEGKKQEIWVAKPCGHVYCGECAENRSKSKAKKTNGAQKTKPFAKCQVPDCGKQISSPTAMFHLYL